MEESRSFTLFQGIVILILLAAGAVAFIEFNEKPVVLRYLGLHMILPDDFNGWSKVSGKPQLCFDPASTETELFSATYVHPRKGTVQLTVEYSSTYEEGYEPHYPRSCHRLNGDVVEAYPPIDYPFEQDTPLDIALLGWTDQYNSMHHLTAWWLVVSGEHIIDDSGLPFKRTFARVFYPDLDHLLLRADMAASNRANLNSPENIAVLTGFLADLHDFLNPVARKSLFGTAPETE